jgi:Na+/H+ antiporter NhaD/arsenite permease-like protein
MNDVTAIILGGTIAAVIARQLLRHGPPMWAIFVTGAFVMVASESVPLSVASTAISANFSVLIFLFAIFLFVAGLEQAGGLDHLARWIVGQAGSSRNLPLVLFVAFAAISAFVLNDGLVLVGVPLLLALARRIRIPPESLLLTLIFSVTVGSVPTPFGNPQNLLVSLSSGIATPVATFLRYLLLPTVVNILLGGLFVRQLYGRRISQQVAHAAPPEEPPVPLLPPGHLRPLLLRAPALLLFPLTMIALVTVDVTSSVTGGPAVPLYLVALGGALLTLLLTPERTHLFARVDWSILLLFGGLFVVVGGAVYGGVLSGIEAIVPIPGPGAPVPALGAILLSSLAGSQLVSNVPWVALQIPALHALGYGASTPWAWAGLAAGSTLAGNLTLLGAASNLIVVDQSEKAGIRIGMRAFLRGGLPLTFLTVGVLFVCLLAGV